MTWDDTLLPDHSATFTAAKEEGRAGQGIIVTVACSEALQPHGAVTEPTNSRLAFKY